MAAYVPEFLLTLTTVSLSVGQNMHVHGILSQRWQTIQAFSEGAPDNLESLPTVVSHLCLSA